ncbi:MAG: hypothetical protein V1662_02890, partial [Candidatus Omnitrophota bacterium]
MKKLFANTRGGKIITAACLGVFLFPAVVCAGSYDDYNGLGFSQGNFTEQNNFPSFDSGVKSDMPRLELRSGVIDMNDNGSLTNKSLSFGGEAWSKPDLSYSSSANREPPTANRDQGSSWRQSQGSGFAEPMSEQRQSGVDKRVYKEASSAPAFGGEAWSKPTQTNIPVQGSSWRQSQGSGFAEPMSEQQQAGVDKRVYKEASSAPAFGGEAWSKPVQTEIAGQGSSSGPEFRVSTHEQQQMGVDKRVYKEANSAPAFGGEAWSKPDLSYSSSANREPRTANRDQELSWRQSQGSGFAEPAYNQQQSGVDKRVYKEASSAPAFGGEAWSKPDLSYSSSANREPRTTNRDQELSWRQSSGPEFSVSTHEQQQSGVDKRVYKEASSAPAFGGEAWSKPDLSYPTTTANREPPTANRGQGSSWRQSSGPEFNVSTHEQQQSGVDKRVYKEANSAPAFGGETWSNPDLSYRSSANREPRTANRQPPTANHEPQTANRKASSGQDNIELLMLHQNEENQDIKLKKENRQTAQELPGAPVMKNVLLPDQVLRLPKTKKINLSIMGEEEKDRPRISLAGILLKLGIPLILCS